MVAHPAVWKDDFYSRENPGKPPDFFHLHSHKFARFHKNFVFLAGFLAQAIVYATPYPVAEVIVEKDHWRSQNDELPIMAIGGLINLTKQAHGHAFHDGI